MQWNVQELIREAGLERVGFLTLTFKGGIPSMVEAQRRFNSFATHVLRPMFGKWVVVVERHRRGGVHFHLLVDAKADIRTHSAGKGVVDFDGFKRRDYRSASPALRLLWSRLRNAALRYGFGERATELLPIKVSGHAVACYLTKYLTKHMAHRRPEDKRKRLVRYSKGANWCRQQISWVSPGASMWRFKLRQCAEAVGGNATNWRLKEEFGPRWAHHLKPIMRALPVYTEPGRIEIGDDERRNLWQALQDLRTRIANHRQQREREPGRSILRISARDGDIERAAEMGESTFVRNWHHEPETGQPCVLSHEWCGRLRAWLEGTVQKVWRSGDDWAVRVKWGIGHELSSCDLATA